MQNLAPAVEAFPHAGQMDGGAGGGFASAVGRGFPQWVQNFASGRSGVWQYGQVKEVMGMVE